jgi:hypothetical protein
MNATHSAQRFGSSRLGNAVIMLGLATGLALGAAVPAAASNPYQGEGMRALGQDFEQSRPALVASVANEPTVVHVPCEAGEGLLGPRVHSNLCLSVATLSAQPVLAFYVCEAGEGLLGPRAQANLCREASNANQ